MGLAVPIGAAASGHQPAAPMVVSVLSRGPLLQEDACPEPNDDPTSACPLGLPAAVQGFISTADDVDAFVVQVNVPARLLATLTNLASDYDLHFVDEASRIVRESLAEGRQSEHLELQIDTPGRYFVHINSGRGGYNESEPYSLLLELLGPEGALTSEPPTLDAPAEAAAAPAGQTQPGFAAPTFATARPTLQSDHVIPRSPFP
jgi:hypothetical protein